MHAGGRDDSIDGASMILRAGTVALLGYTRSMYACFRGEFEAGRIYAGKASML